jgi:vacuolar-type H+-ATPase subunit H
MNILKCSLLYLQLSKFASFIEVPKAMVSEIELAVQEAINIKYLKDFEEKYNKKGQELIDNLYSEMENKRIELNKKYQKLLSELKKAFKEDFKDFENICKQILNLKKRRTNYYHSYLEFNT